MTNPTRKAKTLPSVTIRHASGERAVTPVAVAGIWAVTPSTYEDGKFVVTCLTTGMGITSHKLNKTTALKALKHIAGNFTAQEWAPVARALAVGERADQRVVDRMRVLSASFDCEHTEVVVIEDGEDLVLPQTREPVAKVAKYRRVPRVLGLTTAQLARRAPRFCAAQVDTLPLLSPFRVALERAMQS